MAGLVGDRGDVKNRAANGETDERESGSGIYSRTCRPRLCHLLVVSVVLSMCALGARHGGNRLHSWAAKQLRGSTALPLPISSTDFDPKLLTSFNLDSVILL